MIQKKICMLGSFGVGKTSLVARFVQGIFSTKYQSTVGVKIDKREMKVGDQDMLLMLWDLAGEDSRSQVQTSYLKGAAGYFLVVDGTWSESLVTAKAIHKRVLEAVGDIPFRLIVNKKDLWDKWQISAPDLERLVSEGWKIKLTSAKTGDGVEEMFADLSQELLQQQPLTDAAGEF